MAVALISLNDLAPARKALYRFLLAAFDKPTREQLVWLRGADFAAALEHSCAEFALPCPEGPFFPEDFAEHESRYLACFEVGLPQPPVVLLASHYQRKAPVPAVLHEHILFYQRFGVHLAPNNREPADHLSNQLAFLIRLDDLVALGQPVESILRARQDFLVRHLRGWVGAASRQAAETGLPPVYQALLSLLAVAVEQDLDLTMSKLAECGGGE
jgi:DMSO reductase family type II enzyme chaperone